MCVRVHGWMVSVMASEREHTWDAASGGPESLSRFGGGIKGLWRGLGDGTDLYNVLARRARQEGRWIGLPERGDPLPPPPPPPSPPPPSVSQRRRKNPGCPSVSARTFANMAAHAHARARARAALGERSSSNALTWALLALLNVNTSPARLEGLCQRSPPVRICAGAALLRFFVFFLFPSCRRLMSVQERRRTPLQPPCSFPLD